MPHPLSRTYPLLALALEEQRGIYAFLEVDPLPVALVEAQNRALDIVDAHAPASSFAEKEALLVGVVLLHSTPFVFDDTTRFETDYSPEVLSLVQDFLYTDPRTPPSEKAGIVKAAYDIGMMEQAAAILRLAAPQMSAEEIAHLRTDRQAESSLLFANVRVPVLRGLYDTVGDEILAALEKNAAPTPQKPRVPKGPRP